MQGWHQECLSQKCFGRIAEQPFFLLDFLLLGISAVIIQFCLYISGSIFFLHRSTLGSSCFVQSVVISSMSHLSLLHWGTGAFFLSVFITTYKTRCDVRMPLVTKATS